MKIITTVILASVFVLLYVLVEVLSWMQNNLRMRNLSKKERLTVIMLLELPAVACYIGLCLMLGPVLGVTNKLMSLSAWRAVTLVIRKAVARFMSWTVK